MVDVGLGNIVSSTLTGGYYIFLGAIVIGVIGFGIWYRWYKKQYKYSVKLKILQNRKFVYYEDVARQVTENGTPYWYVRGLKHRTTVPPGDSMYLSPTGRWVAEGYFDRSAGVIWASDKQSIEAFQKLADQLTSDGVKSGEHSINSTFQPITTTQRALQAGQVTRAAMRRGKDLWGMLRDLAAPAFMVIVIALILIFWGQIYQPAKDIQSQGVELMKEARELQQQNLRFYMMLTGGKGNGTYVVQQLSSDQVTFGVGLSNKPPGEVKK